METSGTSEDRCQMYQCSVSLQGGAVEFSHSKSGTKLNVSGWQQETSGFPLLPPPFVHCPSSPQSQFELAFISGNVLVEDANRSIPSHVMLHWIYASNTKNGKNFWDHWGPLGPDMEICTITAMFHVSDPLTQNLSQQCYKFIVALPYNWCQCILNIYARVWKILTTVIYVMITLMFGEHTCSQYFCISVLCSTCSGQSYVICCQGVFSYYTRLLMATVLAIYTLLRFSVQHRWSLTNERLKSVCTAQFDCNLGYAITTLGMRVRKLPRKLHF